ncbi:2-oxoglutarate dehydrogenase, E2 component, dihydrolipoamide succinyltransferase [Saxibacter everestensis]|uniref:Dihydrolipoamide acetyltransferase component of pyruvate dehydrogenase complex n=1 Tax=Saxibacter everestensis TaxID=2909229 RepID=A0ABY8QZ78_9MICO|nr:2-oxoglutarate dehydrogenase, E2 component, dihydrolipoamide succinyltransferase [Brevibacteriaceae bacterium ZFBP1038]
MSNSVQMPALGESVTEGTVTRWLKQVGDEIAVDEPLLEVSTDKVDTEIPSPYAGVVEKILAEEDDTVEVGGDLAIIGDGSGSDDSGAEDEGAADDAGESAESGAEEAPAEEAQDSGAEESAEEAPAEKAPQADASPAGGSAEGTEVKMPALGESVTEGTVTRWLKQVGEEVAVDEPLLEVSTDKVDTEIPSPVAGTISKILAEEDETVEVGGALAIIGGSDAGSDDAGSDDAGSEEPAQSATDQAEEAAAEAEDETVQAESAAQPAQQETPAPKPAVKEQPAPAKSEQEPAAPVAPHSAASTAAKVGEGAGYITPLVRKLAGQHGVDLSDLDGTGVGGRIRKQDVLDAAAKAKEEAPAAAAAPVTEVQVSDEAAKLRGTTQKAPRIRQTIAKRMKESLDVSAQLTQVIEVDMTRIVKLRNKAKDTFLANEGVKLTFLPFFAKAVVEALKQHPKVNASYDEEAKEITYHNAEHLGIAVDTDRGLLAPVIHDAGGLNIAGLAHKIADLGQRTRTNKVSPEELGGGTFTITNIGSVGALFDTPIINQPQVGILGTGAIVKRPVVLTNAEGDDTIAIRSMVYLPLTYDHRLVDGADAGRFLQTIKARLEEGNFESELGL